MEIEYFTGMQDIPVTTDVISITPPDSKRRRFPMHCAVLYVDFFDDDGGMGISARQALQIAAFVKTRDRIYVNNIWVHGTEELRCAAAVAAAICDALGQDGGKILDEVNGNYNKRCYQMVHHAFESTDNRGGEGYAPMLELQ